ncbi:hypothetical protein FQN54_004269 [Arachnomyces sp. PD_36]|nr:hypothetical protein FQN54_004269 [Arachnomyces sp. PD_36]
MDHQQQQPQPPQQSQNPRNPPANPSNGSRPQNRMSGDLRNRAPLPVPSGPGAAQMQNGHSRNMSAAAPFEMARSPPNPNSKNTKHVPCKFFRQGACQAGPACPFLHSTDATIESAPCKYFTKGNCKFGAKCALAHILPDGRRVNRPNVGLGMSGGHLNLGGRVNPQAYHNQDSALANSLLSQQRTNGHAPRYPYPYQGQDEYSGIQPQQPHHDGIPIIDTGFASDNGSKYGSPGEDNRLPMSPVTGHLTALDATLPASFDSQGVSYMARHGPVAASMPSKFGQELSPPPQRSGGAPSEVLRSLHDTAFGSDSRKLSSSNLGSSPPVIQDELNGPRIMHSQRVSRPKMLSASLPRPVVLDDWDDNFTMEEDYLPTNLHDDVLTPQEKMRRLSRTEQDLSSSRGDFTGLGMTGTSASKVGSPLASSPSRFGALFAKQRQKKEEESAAALNQVGSPLRESSLNFGSSPGLRPIGSRPASGDVSPFVASPGRQTSMSMISQQLSGASLHPGTARHSSSVGPGSRLDRAVSSPVTTSRIDEEQGDLVFSMEEEENNKRSSVAWNSNKSTSDEAPGPGHTTVSGQDTNEGKAYLKGMESLYGSHA